MPECQQEHRQLTIHDARNPSLPWLSAGDGPDDYEDMQYAASWVHSRDKYKEA
jgi:hypothetical protein